MSVCSPAQTALEDSIGWAWVVLKSGSRSVAMLLKLALARVCIQFGELLSQLHCGLLKSLTEVCRHKAPLLSCELEWSKKSGIIDDR